VAPTLLQTLTTDEDVFAELRFKIVDIQFDNAYPAGGYPGIRALVGMSQVLAMTLLTRVDQPQFLNPSHYEQTSDKLRIFNSPGAAGSLVEITTGSNYSTVVFRYLVIGR